MTGYKLTVAIPVFNTGNYLEETLECVRNQTIGFENIQMVLVNDASTDCSGEICRRFQSEFKNNVNYIEFTLNHGVSHAKNAGLEIAEGKYITFWDSDDLWSLSAMERAVAFLEEHGAEIDLVSANIEFFERESGGHPTNFELDESRIIDICIDYNRIRSAGAATVMKTAVAKESRFDEKQGYAEDAKFINSIILKKQKYGMLSNVTYYYRRRYSVDSVSQLHMRSKGYFFRDLPSLYEGLYQESMRQCGRIVPMIQYYLAYALGYRFAEDVTVLDEKERAEYEGILKKAISGIEDKYIEEITNVSGIVKCKMLAYKHDLNIQECLVEWEQKERDINMLTYRLERTSLNYGVLKRWFELKQQNRSIIVFFQEGGYKRIAIYGMSDLGIFLYQELADTEVEISYGIDRRADKLDVEIPILTVEEELPAVDAIIVTAVYFFDQINGMLKDRVDCPVISLEEILYMMEKQNEDTYSICNR